MLSVYGPGGPFYNAETLSIWYQYQSIDKDTLIDFQFHFKVLSNTDHSDSYYDLFTFNFSVEIGESSAGGGYDIVTSTKGSFSHTGNIGYFGEPKYHSEIMLLDSVYKDVYSNEYLPEYNGYKCYFYFQPNDGIIGFKLDEEVFLLA